VEVGTSVRATIEDERASVSVGVEEEGRMEVFRETTDEIAGERIILGVVWFDGNNTWQLILKEISSMRIEKIRLDI
jgi:hypothetical protein